MKTAFEKTTEWNSKQNNANEQRNVSYNFGNISTEEWAQKGS